MGQSPYLEEEEEEEEDDLFVFIRIQRYVL